MNTFASPHQSTLDHQVYPITERLPEATVEFNRASRNSRQFADTQIRSLVRRIFSPGWPKPSRQVSFSAIDQETETTGVCEAVARELSAQVSGSVCLTRTQCETRDAEFGAEPFQPFRFSAQQLSNNLWTIPEHQIRHSTRSGSVAHAREQVSKLRLEFDYTIFNCPFATHSDAALFGQLCDGVVLILESGRTRRAAAQRAQQLLQASNVHILGVVMIGRSFPIPERLYKRL